ncbi:MAG: DUF1292 domain-containing protein [Clostridia bacterium]|nr:DUF1292 domain-containing protein [Clostridia bacterium]
MDNESQALGGSAADEMDLDLIEGVDEDGNKVLLEVVRYFYYNGEEYVVMGDAQPEDEHGEECEPCDHDHGDEDEEEAVNLYIMKVVEFEEDGEEMEEFVPVEDEDLLEKLIEIVQTDLETDVVDDKD